MSVKFSVKHVLVLLVMGLFNSAIYSQSLTLKGVVSDKMENSSINGATILLIPVKDSTKKISMLSDIKGGFQFTSISQGNYLVRISYSGYEKIEQKINLQASNKTAIPFQMTRLATDLTGIVVVGKAQPVRQKGDTTEFSASQFKVNPDANAEDMIKKLPGITVASDGTVTAAGEQIRKVTVDGRDFFGDDATAALRNLPADIIDKIQVFDRLSDQAQLTGFDDGNSVKTVNIVTKSGIRNGQFGRIYAGAGTDSRYTAGGNVSFFKGDRRLSLVGNFNNINLQNFASQDLLGVTTSGGGGGRGGGGRGGRGGNQGGGGVDNFTVNQTSGINQTNAFGLNYSNVFKKKLTLTGSYFFNQSNNNNEGLTNLETFGGRENLFSTEKTNSSSINNNHRINLRLEYKIDSSTTLILTPNLSFQDNESTSLSSLINKGGTIDSSTSLNTNTAGKIGYNIRNNILLRHAFKKRGRTISLGFNTTLAKNVGTGIAMGDYTYFDKNVITDSSVNRFTDNATNGTTIGGNISYTESIGKNGQLQINYTPSVQKNKANQQVFNFDGAKYTMFDPLLSNTFDNTITTHNAGVSYRFGRNRDEQLSFGLNFQTTKLESDRLFPNITRVDQSFKNVLPNLMWRKKVSTYSNIRLFYRASTNFPGITQLQDVLNVNNPLQASSGNPALKQSYTNLVSGRYTYINTKTQNSFFANIFLQTVADYITNGTYFLTNDSLIQNVLIAKGSQFSKPVNLDGYKSLRTLFTYSMPIKKIKTTLNLNAGFNYSKLPGLVNNANTITKSYTYTSGLVLASNISEYVDFTVSYNVNFNNSETNTSNSTTTKFVNQATGAQLNLLNKKGWFVQNDVSGNVYSGLSDGFNQRYWLWNAAIGKKILKKQAGEIKLSVFDILKQNQSLIRTVTGSYIEDVQSKVLTQYFMLTFTYKLKNFGTAAAQNNRSAGGNRGERTGGGFGGRPGGDF